MVKDFQPFFNLWTTVDNWRASHHSWINDPFDELDAPKLQDTVESAYRTLAQCLRIFRDKEIPGVQKIAETVKNDVEEFKPYVDLALALRTEGMKERHWEAIS